MRLLLLSALLGGALGLLLSYARRYYLRRQREKQIQEMFEMFEQMLRERHEHNQAFLEHHFHTCDTCGHTWGHGGECMNDIKAHTCEKCGDVQWEGYTFA